MPKQGQVNKPHGVLLTQNRVSLWWSLNESIGVPRGKKNALRAAELALAIAIPVEIEPQRVVKAASTMA